jgi:uncharacterized protein YjbI with pentapeptide repeats
MGNAQDLFGTGGAASSRLADADVSERLGNRRPLPVGATVAASSLRAFVSECDDKVDVPIKLEHVRVEGDLDLRHAEFARFVAFENCEFDGKVDLSLTDLQGTFSIVGCRFAGLFAMKGGRIRSNLLAKRCHFGEGADFSGTSVGGDAVLRGTVFGQPSTFERFHAGGHLDFSCDAGVPARFEADTTFMEATVSGTARFVGAQFEGKASFDRMKCDGSAFFGSQEWEGKSIHVRFAKSARFVAVSILGDAEFRGANFAADTSFNRARVEGGTFFYPDAARNPVRFAGEATFANSRFEGELSFRSAQFEGPVNFYRAFVGGSAYFHPYGDLPDLGPRVEFCDRAHFRRMHVTGDANFSGAIFRKAVNFSALDVEGTASFQEDGLNRPVEFSADPEQESTATAMATRPYSTAFNGARFVELTFNGCRFDGRTNFEAAKISAWASFLKARFSSHVSFREAQVGVLYLRNARPQEKLAPASPRFHTVDFRGCRYERIYAEEATLAQLFEEKFTHQPYNQLEKALRSVGAESRADEVYLAHKRAERRHRFKERAYAKWLINFLHWITARYGVRPYQLVAVPVALLVLATWVFALPGAVRSKDAGAVCSATSLTYRRAFGFGLGQLLPIELPAAANCRPTEQKISYAGGDLWITVDGFATVLRICGWILVPLAVGTVAGVLRRRRGSRVDVE